MTDQSGEMSFEMAVGRLEEIVSAMETGSLSLDDSLARFQEAVALSRLCAARLDQAERAISLLTGDEGATPLDRLPWESESESEVAHSSD